MSKTKTNSIWTAIEEGDLNGILQQLNSNPDVVNEYNKSGHSPLYSAVCLGKKEVAEFLILHGARVNDISKNGFTPLHPAAQFGLLEIVQQLISHGADVNAKNKGTTALHLASQFGRNQIVSFLLDHGAKIDDQIGEAKGKFGRSAISLAAIEGHKETVSLLLSRGAKAEHMILADYIKQFELLHGGKVLFPSICFHCVKEQGTTTMKVSCHETIQKGGTSSTKVYTLFPPICEKCKNEFKIKNKTIGILIASVSILGFIIGVIMAINSTETGFDRYIPIFGGSMIGAVAGYLVSIPLLLQLNPVKVSNSKLVFPNNEYQSKYESIELAEILKNEN